MTQAVVTSIGVCLGAAANVAEFEKLLRTGRRDFSRREVPDGMPAIKAWMPEERSRSLPKSVTEHPTARRILRDAGTGLHATVTAVDEALRQANALDTEQLAIVVAGSNLDQRYATENFEKYRDSLQYANPRYGFRFLDSYLLSAISELFNIGSRGMTVSGAAASGGLAIGAANDMIRAGSCEACLVVGPMAEWSPFEWQALHAMGATISFDDSGDPNSACRPFDEQACGFVPGDGAGAILLESSESARRRDARPRAELLACAATMDGNHLPNPSADGEAKTMRAALRGGGKGPEHIAYINAHATSVPDGDRAEAEAIHSVFGGPLSPAVNSTKALIGHTMFAAGVVELIATILQMNGRFVHPLPTLEHPIREDIPFAGKNAIELDIEYALCNSFGFGGINSSTLIKNLSP